MPFSPTMLTPFMTLPGGSATSLNYQKGIGKFPASLIPKFTHEMITFTKVLSWCHSKVAGTAHSL